MNKEILILHKFIKIGLKVCKESYYAEGEPENKLVGIEFEEIMMMEITK